MITSKRQIVFWIGGIALVFFSSLSYLVFAWSEQGTLSLQIVWFGIRHGTPNNVNLGMPTVSSTDQEISGQFDDNFWIEDLQWYTTGHYTTIQCDGVYWSAGNKLTGVYLKAGNTIPTLLQWSPGNVRIATWLSDYTSILTPITYIYKPTDVANAWLANSYGDTPRLKISIPWWTPGGTYSGTIVYSLYMY